MAEVNQKAAALTGRPPHPPTISHWALHGEASMNTPLIPYTVGVG